MVTASQSKTRVRQELNALGYDFDDFSIDSFVDHISQLRRRPLICCPFSSVPGLSGVWLHCKQVDFIIYRGDTHPMHRNHIILHELAHMILGHPLWPVENILPPALLQKLQAESCHLRAVEMNRVKDRYEEEAELFVDLVQQQVVRAQRLLELTAGSSSIPELNPFVQGLPYGDDEPPG